MMNMVKRLWNEEEGQGMTEYGLIIGIVAVALIAVLAIFRGKISEIFTSVGTTLDANTTTTTTNP